MTARMKIKDRTAVAVLTAADDGRREAFRSILEPKKQLEEAGVESFFDVSFHDAAEPDLYRLFAAVESGDGEGKGAGVLVIDAATLPDPDAAALAIVRYSVAPPRGLGSLRFVFVAATEMHPRDPMFAGFTRVGVYDIIFPSAGQDPSRLIPRLVVAPNRFHDVAAINPSDVWSALAPFPNSPAAIGTAVTPEEARSLADVSGVQRIGVAGLQPRCGTTTAAMAIARSLLIAGHSVSLVLSSSKDFNSVKQMFPNRFNEDGALRLPLGRDRRPLDVWKGKRLADTNEHSQYVVIDYGHISMINPDGIQESPELKDMLERRSEWEYCESKVLVSGTFPADLQVLNDALMKAGRRDVAKWNVFLNLASERMTSIVGEGLSAYQRHVGVFQMGPVPDTLAIESIPKFVKDWYGRANGGAAELKAQPMARPGRKG